MRKISDRPSESWMLPRPRPSNASQIHNACTDKWPPWRRKEAAPKAETCRAQPQTEHNLKYLRGFICLLLLLPDTPLGVSGQIMPRTSRTVSNDAFAIPHDTEDFLTSVFEKRERVTVASATQPKNAVLINSFLLKSTGARPDSEELSSMTDSTVSTAQSGYLNQTASSTIPQSTNGLVHSVVTTVTPAYVTTFNSTIQQRQAKRGQTGRPNFFYLGDDSGEFDSDFADLTESSNGSAILSRHSAEVWPTTTLDPLAGFYGNAVLDAGRPSPATANSTVSIQSAGLAGGSPQNFQSTRLPYPFTIASLPASPYQPGDTNLISGHFQVEDAPRPGQQYTSDNVNKQRSQSPMSDFPFIQRQGQGSVFNAPNPSQPNNSPEFPGIRSSVPVQPPSRRYQGLPDSNPQRENYLSNHPDNVMPPPFRVAVPSPDSLSDMADDGGIKLETCSIGDDSTCSETFNEVCRVDDGAATCLCRLGSSRLRLREQCQGVLSYLMYVRINRLQDHELRFGGQFADKRSRPYASLERQILLGIDSLMRSSRLSGQYAGSKLNSFAPIAEDGLLANITINLFKGASFEADLTNVPTNIQESALDQLRLSQRRLGSSDLYVGSLLTAIPSIQDINECLSSTLNDCPTNISTCINSVGSFTCSCRPGYGDRYAQDPLRSGRTCETCEEIFCNQHGICLLDNKGEKFCQCSGWYIGKTCQTDGQVVAVACGSSAIAVILIAITLVFLLRWSRGNTSSRGDPSSTLGRSEISANTFTYVKNSPPLATLSQASLDNKVRMAYLVHPSLLSRSQMASQRAGSDQLLDNNFYEVRPPPGRLGPSQALIAAELLYHKQRSGSSRDQLAGDLSSLESQVNHQSSPESSS